MLQTCGKFWANTVTALWDDSPLGKILTFEAIGSWYNFMFCIFLANFTDGSFFMFRFRVRFIWCVFTSSNWFWWYWWGIKWEVKVYVIIYSWCTSDDWMSMCCTFLDICFDFDKYIWMKNLGVKSVFDTLSVVPNATWTTLS